MNLPYSDSEEEREEGADLAERVVAENEELPSPTPKDQGEPVEKASSRNPKAQKVSQLLSQVYELEVLEREIKRNNAMLTKRNKKLHNSFLEMSGMYILLKRRNLRYMKENTRLYKMIRLLRLQVKNSRQNPSTHFSLEALAEVVVSLQNTESIQDATDPPNV